MCRSITFLGVLAVLGLLFLGCGGEASKEGGASEPSGSSADAETPSAKAVETVTLRVEGIT
ncbi:MAG: hypothetical protein ACYS47_19520 [Planctomycetota bacterium]